MATVSYRLEDLKKAIVGIGYVGENDHMHVLIDCKEVFDEYQDAVPTMAIVPPVGEGYPKAVTRNGDVVEWLVKDSDVTVEGDGEFQLTFTEGEIIRKSVNGRFRVKRSISGSGSAPSGVQDWLTDANEKLAEVEEATRDAEAAANHQPYIGIDGYWYTWNGEEFVKNVKAQGDKGDPGDPGSPGDPTQLINDQAGHGVTGKTWSADKLDSEFGSVLSDIQGKAPAVLNTVSGAVATFDDGIANAPIESIISDFWYTKEEGTPTPSNPKQIYGKKQISVFNSGEDTTEATETVASWENELGTIYGVKSVDVSQGRMLVHIVDVDLGELNWVKQSASAKDYFYVPISELEHEPIYKTEYVSSDYKSACTVFKKVHQSDTSWGTNTYLFTGSAGTLPAKVLAVNAVKNAYADAAAFKTAMSGQILVYEIAEPFELEFTPVSIEAKSGVNKLWIENGREVTVSYAQETTKYIEDKTDEISENTQGIKQIINQYTSNNLVDGVVNYDGTIWGNPNYVTTDYIEIPPKYNKNINYIHVFDNNGYAYYIGFYDASKQFVERFDNISNAVATNQSSKYVRVSFLKDGSDRAVIFTNENTKPQYEPPKKYLLYDNDLNSYDKNVISDGAVSAMIATGLMYFGDEQFGYGTEHTLFATSCVKSTKDTHTESSGYSGERYQMDCSAYAQIMLMGITPECSRYFGTKNIQSPYGYRFNRYVQYEGYVYNVLQEANTKRLYANAIAEYAYKNGYLFLVNDGFTNIRPGDVIFLSNQASSYHFFEDIGHCMVVADVVPMENGDNTIVTLEGKGGTGSPCQHRTYTSRDDVMVYAARFPMPYVHDDTKDIASFANAITTEVSGASDAVVDIATVQTTKDLEAGRMYTVLLKCDMPDNCYPKIKANGMTHTGIANENMLKRPDGYYVFRIFSKKTDTLSESNSITIQAHCTGSVSDDAVIEKVKIYDGFVTPMFD